MTQKLFREPWRFPRLKNSHISPWKNLLLHISPEIKANVKIGFFTALVDNFSTRRKEAESSDLYLKVHQDDRVEKSGDCVENTHIEAIGDKKQHVVSVSHQPLDGGRVVDLVTAAGLSIARFFAQPQNFLGPTRRGLRLVLKN